MLEHPPACLPIQRPTHLVIVISVTVNGALRQFEPPLTCAGLIAALGLAGKRVALECNGEIVPRSELASREIANGDQIEIVVAVGGG